MVDGVAVEADSLSLFSRRAGAWGTNSKQNPFPLAASAVVAESFFSSYPFRTHGGDDHFWVHATYRFFCNFWSWDFFFWSAPFPGWKLGKTGHSVRFHPVRTSSPLGMRNLVRTWLLLPGKREPIQETIKCVFEGKKAGWTLLLSIKIKIYILFLRL